MDNKNVGNKPTVLWTLLKQFCKNQGLIRSDNPKYSANLPSTAKRLNKHMRKIFQIDESIYEGHYRKLKGYKSIIFFSDKTKATP